MLRICVCTPKANAPSAVRTSLVATCTAAVQPQPAVWGRGAEPEERGMLAVDEFV